MCSLEYWQQWRRRTTDRPSRFEAGASWADPSEGTALSVAINEWASTRSREFVMIQYIQPKFNISTTRVNISTNFSINLNNRTRDPRKTQQRARDSGDDEGKSRPIQSASGIDLALEAKHDVRRRACRKCAEMLNRSRGCARHL